MKKLLLFVVVPLVALIALPPLWFALFPAATATLPPPQTRVDLAYGVSINALDSGGDGASRSDAIVLVHGLPGTAYDWRELAPLLADAGHRVIAIDRVGYGHSSGRTAIHGDGDPDYSLRANTRDLLALLTAMDLRDTTVVGWSYGGVMAMDAASIDPSRIARIILVGSGGPSSDDDAPPQAGAALRFFYSLPVLRWRAMVPPVSHSLMAVLSERAFSGGDQPQWWLQGLIANFSRWETTLSYRGEILAPIGDLLQLDDIRVPTHIVHGDNDQLAPVSIGRYLSTRIAGADYTEVAGGSHMLPVTHPRLLANEILGAMTPGSAQVQLPIQPSTQP